MFGVSDKKISYLLLFLRLTMGVLFFYAGWVKIVDPNWSAADYLARAQTFTVFYQWLAQPQILPWVNWLNEWGLIVLGASLILGLWVFWSAWLGALLMLLYYFPVLNFPYVGAHSFVVDEHIIYFLLLILLALTDAGRFWGMDKRFS